MSRLLGVAFLLLGVLAGLFVYGGATSDSVAAPEPVKSVELLGIPNATLVDETIVVGGQPTLEDLDAAVSAGFTTVINLRPEGEFSDWDEEAEVVARGLRYVSIPVAGAAGLTEENAARLRSELDRVREGPVLVHCASGNRVGALLALGAYHFENAAPERALEIGLEGGLTSLEPRVAEYLAEQMPQ